jgi:hypothetical protein
MSTFRRALSVALSLVALAAVAVVQGSDQGAQQPTGQQPSGQQQPAGQGAPPAQQADQQQPPPTTIRRGINYVSVDVIVTDKDGKPVMDLTQDDFSVAEDNKPQKVETFQIIKLDALETMESGPPRPIHDDNDEEREAARPDVRLFVILLDDYHVTRGNDLSSR